MMALPAGRYGVTKEMLEYLKNPGSAATISEGIIEVSSTENTKVELGFKPNFVLVYSKKLSSSTVISGMSSVLYDEEFVSDLSSVVQLRAYKYGSYSGFASYLLPYAGADTNVLASVDDDGFTIGKWDTANYTEDGTVKYVAAIL